MKSKSAFIRFISSFVCFSVKIIYLKYPLVGIFVTPKYPLIPNRKKEVMPLSMVSELGMTSFCFFYKKCVGEGYCFKFRK